MHMWQSRVAFGPARLQIRRTRSMKKPCCAALRRIHATSRPSTVRVKVPALRRPSFGLMGLTVLSPPYGVEGLLIADLDLTLATGLLASRCRIRYLNGRTFHP